MLDKAMKYAFAVIGAVTGLTITRFVLQSTGANLTSFINLGIMVAASIGLAP